MRAKSFPLSRILWGSWKSPPIPSSPPKKKTQLVPRPAPPSPACAFSCQNRLCSSASQLVPKGLGCRSPCPSYTEGVPSLGWGRQDNLRVLERWKLELAKLQLRAGMGVDLACTHSPQVVSDDRPRGNLIPQRWTPEEESRKGSGRRPVK